MKIFIPLIGAKYHGGVRVLFQIANYLSSNGYQCILIAPSFAWKPIYKLDKDISLQLIQSKNIITYLFKLILFIRRNNKKDNKKQIWILSHWLTGIINILSKNKSNAIFLIQDSEEVFFYKKSFKGRLMRNLVFFSYKKSTKNFVVTTTYGFRKLKRILKKNKNSNIYFIPLGIDKNIFKVDKSIKKLKQILFFPRKGWFKGFDLLVEIFEKLYNDKNLKDYKFIFVSQETDLFRYIKEISNNDRRVNFKSINNDIELSKLYNESLLLIHTSKYEGICLPILEAISCGTFVATTNSFGPLTYLNKTNSIVFVVRDSDLIYKEITNLLQNPDVLMNNEEISKSVKKFDIQNFLNSFKEILKNF